MARLSDASRSRCTQNYGHREWKGVAQGWGRGELESVLDGSDSWQAEEALETCCATLWVHTVLLNCALKTG